VLNGMCNLPGARNVLVGFFGTIIRIAFDAAQDYGPSSSGRTRSIASSCGNRSLGTSGLAVCINAWYKESRPANPKVLADGLGGYLGSNIKGMCQGTFAIFSVDLSVDGAPGAGARVSKTIATSNGNHHIGESNVAVSMLIYVTKGNTLDLSGLPTTTSLSVGPWPGPNWEVTVQECIVFIDVDYSSVNEGSTQLKEKKNEGKNGVKKAKVVAEHGSFPMALGDAGVNLTFQVSTCDDAIEVKEETKDWMPIGSLKKDGAVHKGVYFRCCKGKLFFKLDPNGDFGTSTSGLSSVVATTAGRVSIPGTNMLGMINAFRKIDGARRTQSSQEIELRKRSARAKKLAIEKKAKATGVKKEAAANEILSAIAQKIRQVARSRKEAKGKPKTDGQASKSKKVCSNVSVPARDSAMETNLHEVTDIPAPPADESTAAFEADVTGKTQTDQVEQENDDAPITLLKRPLLPSTGVSESPAKKPRPADKETNGKKDATSSKVGETSMASKKVEKVKSKKDSGIKKGASMNHRNVTAAVQAYMKKHPEWTLSLMREEISEDYDWENGPKLKMFITTALKELGGSTRGGNVLEGMI